MRIEKDHLVRRASRRSAFTLMEVLVVVAILVVLAGVGGVIYMRIQEDANRDLARVQVKEVETAVKAFERANGRYPDALQEVVQPPDGGSGYLEQSKLLDPWGQMLGYNPQPQRLSNQQRRVPDIWSEGVPGTGIPIGNWDPTVDG